MEKFYLYIARHAKSSWKFPEKDDYDRPLKPRGIRDSQRMGAYLAAKEPLFFLNLNLSGARRAQETAIYLQLGSLLSFRHLLLEDQWYCFDSELAQYLSKLEVTAARTIIGHEPALSILVTQLTGKQFEHIPTCSYVRLSGLCYAGQTPSYDLERMKLDYLVTPKVLGMQSKTTLLSNMAEELGH